VNAPDSYGSRDRITKYPELKFEKKYNSYTIWIKMLYEKWFGKNYKCSGILFAPILIILAKILNIKISHCLGMLWPKSYIISRILPLPNSNKVRYPNPNPIIIFVSQSNSVRKKSEAHLCVMRICMFSHMDKRNFVANIIKVC